MVIYGVAILSVCMLIGSFAGELIGRLIGIDANVGGVGIAMLCLLFFTNFSSPRASLQPASEKGIAFWSAMYIPIVVAMAAKQNVAAAIEGGWMAFFAGALAVTVSFALVPVLTKIAGATNDH